MTEQNSVKFCNNSGLHIIAKVSDQGYSILKGNDGGSVITALTLDIFCWW